MDTPPIGFRSQLLEALGRCTPIFSIASFFLAYLTLTNQTPGCRNDGCASDYVLPWEAVLGGALLLAGIAFALAPAARRGDLGKALGRLLLAVATTLTIAGIYSYGLFTAPVMIPPLWLAARTSRSWARSIWIVLASICGAMTGILFALSFDLNQRPVALSAGGLVLVVFIATTNVGPKTHPFRCRVDPS